MTIKWHFMKLNAGFYLHNKKCIIGQPMIEFEVLMVKL